MLLVSFNLLYAIPQIVMFFTHDDANADDDDDDDK
jgi:hypothetical protein